MPCTPRLEWHRNIIFQSCGRGYCARRRAPVKCYQGNNVSELVDYIPLEEFSIKFCTRGYCRGNPLSSWNLANVDYPCRENREGPLCGQCKLRYTVTLYSTVSSKVQDLCENVTIVHYALSEPLLYFDSLLFFIQVHLSIMFRLKL